MELDLSRGMLRLFSFLSIFIFSISLFANAKSYNFELVKKGVDDNNTLLVVGGIQGDEPGGFMAASLLATHYDITKGSVWIVPNLNFYSIIKRSRGPYGDMNRKFADLPKHDPEYHIVDRIKSYIASDTVKLVVNLHDGSGFFRYKYIDKLHSPHRWGQCSIIDQEKVEAAKYGNLKDISQQICDHVNQYLIKEEHSYRLHDTQTAKGNQEMAKTLTYFAINKGKAAFGNEASKELPTHERVYYHLLALEKYMKIMGIEFKRKFTLAPKKIKNVLDKDISISFYDDKIKLPLSEIKNIVKYFPMKDGEVTFVPSSPLMTVYKKGNYYTIQYGNRRIARLKPDYFEMTPSSDEKVKFNIDGKSQEIKFGTVIDVKNHFRISPNDDYRINVIGYVNKKYPAETGINIKKAHISKRFSIDKKGKIFRIEFYKKDKNKKEKFAGMILVRFDNLIKKSANDVQNFVYGENKINPNS